MCLSNMIVVSEGPFPLYIFAGPCPGRVRSWPLNLKSNKKHKQQQSHWSNDSAIVGVFVELLNCCCFLLNYCLLFKQSLTLGGAVREPWATTIVPCFTFGGTFFSVGFLALTFSTKTHICHQTGPKMTHKSIPNLAPDLFVVDFLHPLFLMACAVFLIDFTVSACSKTHTKQNKNKALKRQWNNMSISGKKQEISRKWLPNSVQMGEFILGNSTLAPLVAPLAPQTVFLSKKCSQSAPKVIPGLQKWLQKGSQSGKSGSQVIPNSNKW